jgi:hypothetical protein
MPEVTSIPDEDQVQATARRAAYDAQYQKLHEFQPEEPVTSEQTYVIKCGVRLPLQLPSNTPSIS